MSTLDHDHLVLAPHPSARDRAVAGHDILPGSVILSTLALASVLLPTEKGRRCDGCHSHRSDAISLRRCSGCSSYWYCSADCQNMQWKAHHRVLCKAMHQFLASSQYQNLTPHEQLTSLLLSHLIAEYYSGKDPKWSHDSAFAILLSLMEGPRTPLVPTLCPMRKIDVPKPEELVSICARFGNNNFAIHSHMTVYAHGIFPLASRFFNHSCVPNAAAKFIIKPAQVVSMEVVALSSIPEAAEVCLPYLDPALLQSRQRILRSTYGFNCSCSSCVTLQGIGKVPPPPRSLTACRDMERTLCRYVFPGDTFQEQALTRQIDVKGESFPKSLYSVLQESCLADLSDRFSRTSHEGPLDIALENGLALLSLYLLIYPLNYPQIGLHLLEMAKTAWNASFTMSSRQTGSDEAVRILRKDAQAYLSVGRRILTIFGPEGDEPGPLEEIQVLQDLLTAENID